MQVSLSVSKSLGLASETELDNPAWDIQIDCKGTK
jgi:hypothetical protein